MTKDDESNLRLALRELTSNVRMLRDSLDQVLASLEMISEGVERAGKQD